MGPQENRNNALVPASEGRALVPERKATKKTGYWGRVAARYTAAWRAILVVTVLFAVLFVLLFSRAFTYDSVFCFFRDLKSVSAFAAADHGAVSTAFEAGDCVALSYRGGVALVKGDGVEVYAPNGERLFKAHRSFKSPRAVASRKYLVAYDNGGTTFSVTNSYTELFHGESEYPILGAAVSDSGHFALITTSGDALSQVLLYDGNFNLIQRFQRASATVGVHLSEDCRRIAILGMTAENGTVRSVLSVYRPGADDPERTVAFEGEIPLAVRFTKGKNYTVLTDAALRCYDSGGDLRSLTELEGNPPVGFAACEDGTVLVLETDGIRAAHRVLVLDKKGRTVYDGSYGRDVKGVALTGDIVYLLSDGEVAHIDTGSGETHTFGVERGATDIFAVDEERIRVVYPARVAYIELARRK